MIDKINLVSEREVAVRRACADLNRAIKELTANMLRIIAGAGKSSELIEQIQPIVAACESLMKLTGNSLAAEIQIEQTLQTLDWRANNPNYSRPSDEDLARWEIDGSADLERAERAIVKEACQIVAAQIAEEPNQESKRHYQFVTAIKDYVEALDRHRRKL
jgi:hypothetical protein